MIKRAAAMAVFLACVVSAAVQASPVETVIRVAVPAETPPYQFLEGERVTGLHIELMDEVARRNNYLLQYVPMVNKSQYLAALEQGEVDMVLGVVPEADVRYAGWYSESFSSSSVSMFAHRDAASAIRANINDMAYKSVYEKDTLGKEYAPSLRFLGNKLAPSQVQALEMLMQGEADILLGVKESILYQLRTMELEEQYSIVNNHIAAVDYCALVKEDPQLLGQINATLKFIRLGGAYETIYGRWFAPEEYRRYRNLRLVFGVIGILAATISAVCLFNLHINRLLREQVAQKTRQLQAMNADLERQVIQTRNIREMQVRIVENSPSGIAVVDQDYIITLTNDSFCRMVGVTDCVGRSIMTIPGLQDLLEDKLGTIFQEPRQYLNQERYVEWPGEAGAYYRYDIYCLFELDGRVRGAILSISDATAEVKAKEQIYEREKTRSLNRMVAGIAHEVRNPLTAIKTFIEMIPQAMGNPEFRRHLVEIVPKEVDRVSSLITDLMDYAKPEQKEREVVLVDEVLASSVALLRHVVEREQVEIAVASEQGLTILAEKNRLRQVLINIILNALDAVRGQKLDSGQAGIRVDAWQREEWVSIRITDRGVGMLPEEIKRVSDPFFTTKPGGTGLGMYLSRQYIEENGGTLAIESKKGSFTRVTIGFRRFGNG